MNKKTQITETRIDFKVEKETAIAKITSISEECNNLVEIGMEIEVKNPESLVIAKQKLSEAKELIDMTEKVRKVYVDEPNAFVKDINAYTKKFLEPINNMITYLKDQAKAYQELESARIRLEQEKASRELDEKLGKEKEDLKKLSRAAVQIHARIYGGSYKTGTGEIKSSAGCITTKQCNDLRDFLAISYPSHEAFNSHEEKSRELMGKFISMITGLEKNLELSNSANPKIAEKANKEMIRAKTNSEKLITNEFEKLGTVIIRTAEKKAKDDAKAIAAVSKGLRKIIVWEVINEEIVPDNYKTVDENKVNEFLSKHRDDIRTMVEAGTGDTIIKGIEFLIKTSHVIA